MSSMSIYGMETGVITKDTAPNPKSHYGKSKLQAEQGITALEDESFRVAVIRPPMIYGKGCKGNYQKLAKLARITPVFPDIENKRSMVYMDNLSEFVRKIIESENAGLYLPQNGEYVCTKELISKMAEIHGKRIYFIRLASPIIGFFIGKNGILTKLFGNLYYMSERDLCNTFSLYESICLTELSATNSNVTIGVQR